MDQSNNQGIKPPDRNETKKPEGQSFVRRNNWLIIVIIGVVIIGVVCWMVYRRVDKAMKRYKEIVTQADTANDDATDADSTTLYTESAIFKSNSIFKEPYDPGIKSAKLNITGGAAIYRLKDTTSELFKANAREVHGRFQFDSHKEGSVMVIDLSMKNKKNWSGNDSTNRADLMLNTKPEWDISIETGATELNFDLSKYKLRSMSIKGGAAEFVVKVGQPLANTNITVSTGASEVTIKIPKDAACSIETTSGLSSNTFEGFSKKDDNHYQTKGFDAAKHKILINLSGGISDYKVQQY